MPLTLTAARAHARQRIFTRCNAQRDAPHALHTYYRLAAYYLPIHTVNVIEAPNALV